MFFVCIAYACVFTYFLIREYFPNINELFKSRIFLFVLIILSLILFLFNLEKMYTSYAFRLLSFVLFYYLYIRININAITISFISILPFMLISNGLFTGMFIKNKVVWYNDLNNLGFKIFTITFEDFFMYNC